jgi:hypothetical protein
VLNSSPNRLELHLKAGIIEHYAATWHKRHPPDSPHSSLAVANALANVGNNGLAMGVHGPALT